MRSLAATAGYKATGQETRESFKKPFQSARGTTSILHTHRDARTTPQMVVRTRVFESDGPPSTKICPSFCGCSYRLAKGTNSCTARCPAVQHPRMPERSCTDPRLLAVHFPDTKSHALATSTMAQNALRIGAGVLVAAGVSALLNRWLAQKAERQNPPLGRFITVDGARLHYVDRGTGTPVVLLHGNGSMIEDFQSSGLIDLAAKNYRVIAIDRPGFGHSNRPRITVWTPQAQADL